jgi:hypothetical protein
VRIVGDEGLAEFARITVQGRATRIFIVSPWVSSPSSLPELSLITGHLERRGGDLIVVTRVTGEGAAQRAAVKDLIDRPRASVYESPNLHAKMCVARLPGGRLVALVGSANVTTGSRSLREAGVLLLAKRRSQLGQDLEDAVHSFKACATQLHAVELDPNPLDIGVAASLPAPVLERRPA